MTHNTTIPLSPTAQDLAAMQEAREITFKRFDPLIRHVKRKLKRWNVGNSTQFSAVIQDACKAKPDRTMKSIKAKAIDAALRECGGHQANAAKVLGITRGTVWNRLRTINQVSIQLGLIVGIVLLASATRSLAALISLPQPVASLEPSANPNLGSWSLAWDKSPDTNAVSYSLSYGTNRTALNNSVGVGLLTNYTISGLQPLTTNYCVAYSLNALGVMGEPSNMVTNFIQPRMVMVPDRWKVWLSLPAGRTHIVQSCTNANFVGTVRNLLTNSSGGSIWFYATNDATQNFYRVKPN